MTKTSIRKSVKKPTKKPTRKPVIDRDKAKHAAHYWGAECQANPETSFADYKDDMASKYGFAKWDEMPLELMQEASSEFNAGKAAERKLQHLPSKGWPL
jgi:hypothetical protein